MHALWISLGCNATPPPGTTAAAAPSGDVAGSDGVGSGAALDPTDAPDSSDPSRVEPPKPGTAPPRELPPPPAGLTPLASNSPAKEKISARRQQKLDGFAAEDIAALTGRTVLVGDSITAGYPTERLLGSFGVVNRGIGGDTIGAIRHPGVYDRLESTVYNLQPSRIILMIGTNDLLWSAGTTLETKQLQYEHLVWKIRHDLPETPLVCVSVLPARGSHAKKNADIVAFNRTMSDAVTRYGASWLDVTAAFADGNGLLREELARDAVHINSRGYERLTEIYRKEIFAKDDDVESNAQR